jgi:hypothetical protein
MGRLVQHRQRNALTLLKPIGNIPPAEAEANYYAALETEAKAAQQTSVSLRHTRSGPRSNFVDFQTALRLIFVAA